MDGNERKMNGNERKMEGNERNMKGKWKEMNEMPSVCVCEVFRTFKQNK